jgi:UDP-glucose:(heptosyl)LPS alpha-1,3-glucosyltransferase
MAGLHLHCLTLPRRGWAADRALWRASRDLDRTDFAIVQGFGRTTGHDIYRAGGGVHSQWLAASADSPMRRLKHTMSPAQWWALRVDRAACRQARRVICNSERVAAEVVVIHEVSEARVTVVRNGVDPHRFRPDPSRRRRVRARLGGSESGRIALFVGSGFYRKGLGVAVRAFDRVKRPGDRLVVIGRDARATTRITAARRILGEQLVHLGEVDDPETWLAGADATILPTRYDAAANTTLEAMACGVPPVTSRMDGNCEVVPDDTLVVADPTDVDGFAHALHHAWSAGPQLGVACRETALAWSISRNGEAMNRIYGEVCHE